MAQSEPDCGSALVPASLREETTFVRATDGQSLALTEVHRSSAGGDEPVEDGLRPVFLLLHGFAQNRLAYTLGSMPECLLDRGARVFLGEFRGHGDSKPQPGAVWSMDDHLDLDCPALIRAVQDRAQVESIHLIGHSMGGLLGSALLGRGARYASFTAAATPILLGAKRPLVRLASAVLGPFATFAPRSRRIPVDWFLRQLASPLASAGARGPAWALQRLTRLANPDLACPEAMREILENANRESPAVMQELAKNAVLLRPTLCGVDLSEAVREADCPIAAIVGSRDIFAPRAAVAPLEEIGQHGPRKIVEIEGGTHIDAIMGHHVPATIDALWGFWMAGA